MAQSRRFSFSRMRLSTRLALSMTALVMLTATSMALLTYRSIENVAVPRALDQIDIRARMLASELEASMRGTRADVTTQGAAVSGLVRARIAGGIDPISGVSEEHWRERLAGRFVAELGAKPAYAQYRLIGTADGGREIVRVDRSGPNGAIRVVPEAELQRNGDRDYFANAIKLRAGDIHASPIDLNRERGVIQTPHMPTLRVAAPVFARNGTPFGILIVNVDLRATFDRIRSARAVGRAVYLVNARGDYLVHPDRTLEFGFEFSRSHRIQDDFPDLAPLLSVRSPEPRILASRTGERFGAAAATVRLADRTQVAVVETVPYADIIGVTAPIRTSSLVAGTLAALVAVGFAVVLARSLTLPLLQMARAVEGFARGSSITIPRHASREIRVLGQAFERLTADVREKAAALTREAEQYQRVFEASLDLILVADRRGTLIQVSPSCSEILGYRPEEMVQRSAEDFLFADDLEHTRTQLRLVRRGRRARNFETRYVHRDGHVVCLTWTGVWSEQVRLYFFIGRDMTDAKRAQDDLRESEALARGIVETALDAFVQMDSCGRITDWNAQAAAVFGWSREEAIGSVLGDLIVPQRYRSRYKANLARFRTRGESALVGRRLVLDALRSDGREIKVEVSVTPLRRRDGMVLNAFLRDITEKLSAEGQLRQAQKMEAVGQLTGGIAHDFNNILTVITGTIEILRDAVADEPQLAQIAGMIDDAAQRGADLTRHLLAFARKQPLQPRATDVGALLVEFVKLLRPTLGEQVEIDLRTNPLTWPALVDPSQLTTALLNLALNSRDAMPNGGKLTIETSNLHFEEACATPGREPFVGPYVMIAVSDTGSGIPAALREKIFEPFFTSKSVGKGTGLGLSMVYGFVKQSGGHVRVESNVGEGTTFKLYLPKATRQVAEPDMPLAVEAGSETVLVVEDDPLVRRNVLAQLGSLGYGALAAANAAEALAMIEGGEEFDLLLTDVVMPGQMNGHQLAEEAQKRRPGIGVLFSSGYPENVLVHDGRLDVGVLLLSKPYRISDLARMLRQARRSIQQPSASVKPGPRAA